MTESGRHGAGTAATAATASTGGTADTGAATGTGAATTIDGVLAGICREQAVRLVSVLLVRGAALDTAAHLAQDTMSAARSCSDRVPDLATWTYRVATAAWDRRSPAAGPLAPVLLAAGTDPAAWAGRQDVLARLGGLSGPQRRVAAAAMLGWSPGRIGYELALPAVDVRRLLREAEPALREPGTTGATGATGAARDLSGALAAALGPVLDLEAGLAALAGPETCPGLLRALPRLFGYDADLALRPHALPAPAGPTGPGVPAPAPGVPAGPPVSALHAHAHADRTGPGSVRHAFHERGRQPRAELAAVRLATLLALHTDRFREELRLPGRPAAPAEDSLTFAVALARDVRSVADRFPGGPGAAASRAAGGLVEALSDEDPDPLDVDEAALGLAKAMSVLRARSLDAALRAVRPWRASRGPLMAAVTHDLLRARNMSDELEFLEADLAYDLLQPAEPGSDGGRDLARHRAFNERLCAGIDRIEDADGDVRDADLSTARLDGIPPAGVRWTAGTRWPAAWGDPVRAHSVETAPGHFTIVPGPAPDAGSPAPCGAGARG